MFRVLLLTCEWPSSHNPESVPFLLTEISYLRKAGLEIEVFNFQGKKNFLRYLFAWFRLRFLYDLTKFDIIHAEWGQSALLALPKKIPLIITFRGSDLEGIVGRDGKYTLKGRLLQFISKRIARIADEVILVSESLSKYLPGISYHLIPACIDLNLFQIYSKELAREKLNLPIEKKLVLFASNPNRPEKRFDLARQAVKALGDNVELVVVNNVPHDQMPYYFNACDVLILTSSHEGSPTVVIEALACNLPVVSVDVGDVNKRLSNIEGCIVCPNDQIETISNCLRIVLNQQIRVKSRSSVEELSSESFVQKTIEIYRDCIQNP